MASTDAHEVTAVLHALADPVRLEIVRQLASATAPIACGDFGLTVVKSTRSHHFRVLRDAGVIGSQRVAGRVLNELRRADLDASYPGLLDAVLGSHQDVELEGA
ncbi:ArsR/SmtB family transcription factor [Microbacterium gorillae]|uniref:ArsR/SmtB family transcription factor n=1 Tax=Microbacterium gorillae TaxID=1231063 RepID=UPI00058B359E|nr:helix-turn-helix transcriptional regulator [Microbacterium gorillae]